MRENKWIRLSLVAMRMAVFALSAILIVYISVDTFTGRDFLANQTYMKFQFWMCMFFIFDFLYELAFAADRKRYLKTRWFFLLMSVPYLNLVAHYHISLSAAELYWVRFVPLGRATMALALVVGYLSKNRVSSVLASYIMVLLAFIYFGSIIFFNAEHATNPRVHSYWNALWWASMDTTTIGCDIQPLTVVGKVTSAVLACMGVMVFPLFTVYVTNLVTRLAQAHRSAPAASKGGQ